MASSVKPRLPEIRWASYPHQTLVMCPLTIVLTMWPELLVENGWYSDGIFKFVSKFSTHICVYICLCICMYSYCMNQTFMYIYTHTIIIVFTHTLDFYTSSSPRSAFTSLQNVGGVGGDLGLSQVDARDLVGLGDPMGIQCGEIARDNLTTVRIAIKGLSLTIHIIWSPWLIISIILVAILVSL